MNYEFYDNASVDTHFIQAQLEAYLNFCSLLGSLKPTPVSRLRGAKQPSSFAQLRTLYIKVRSWRTTWR